MSDPITDEAIANLIGACSLSADRGFVQCDTHDMIVIYPDQDGPVREVCQEFLAFRSLATKVRADEAAKSREVIEALALEVMDLRAHLAAMREQIAKEIEAHRIPEGMPVEVTFAGYWYRMREVDIAVLNSAYNHAAATARAVR